MHINTLPARKLVRLIKVKKVPDIQVLRTGEWERPYRFLNLC